MKWDVVCLLFSLVLVYWGPKFYKSVLLILSLLWQLVSCCGRSQVPICLPILASEGKFVLASGEGLLQSRWSRGLVVSGVVLSKILLPCVLLLLFLPFWFVLWLGCGGLRCVRAKVPVRCQWLRRKGVGRRLFCVSGWWTISLSSSSSSSLGFPLFAYIRFSLHGFS